MIDSKDLPDEEDEISRLELDFPRLEDDSPKGCPVSMAEIRKYVKAEAAKAKAPDILFGRTALVGDVKFWLWGYVDADNGETYFIDVGERDGYSPINMENARGLTPEQYLGLQYARWWRDKKPELP